MTTLRNSFAQGFFGRAFAVLSAANAAAWPAVCQDGLPNTVACCTWIAHHTAACSQMAPA